MKRYLIGSHVDFHTILRQDPNCPGHNFPHRSSYKIAISIQNGHVNKHHFGIMPIYKIIRP